MVDGVKSVDQAASIRASMGVSRRSVKKRWAKIGLKLSSVEWLANSIQ